MSRYAERTSVPVGKTKAELDALLAKHGATQRGVFEEASRGIVMFTMRARQIRLVVKLPKVSDGQEARTAWRRMLLVTKAKLEMVADQSLEAFELEFLGNVLLPDGRTVHEALAPQLAQSYADGRMPPLLPGASK